MFKNNTDKTRYADLELIFGESETNKKASFIMNILYDNVTKHHKHENYNSHEIIYDISILNELDARLDKNYYSNNSIDIENYDNTDYPIEMNIHSEIRDFGFHYNMYATKFNANNRPTSFYSNKNKKLVELVSKYSTPYHPSNSLNYFKQQLINLILCVYDSDDKPLSIPQWNNASYVKYCSKFHNEFLSPYQIIYLSDKYTIPYDTSYTPYTRNNGFLLEDDGDGDGEISELFDRIPHGEISELFDRIPHGKLENDSYPTTTIDNAIISQQAESKSNQTLGKQQKKSSKGISKFYGNVPELQIETTLPTPESKVTPRFGERQRQSSTKFPFSLGTNKNSPNNGVKSLSTQELMNTLDKQVQNLQQQSENKPPKGKKNVKSLRRNILSPRVNVNTDVQLGGSNIHIPSHIQPFVDTGKYNIFFNILFPYILPYQHNNSYDSNSLFSFKINMALLHKLLEENNRINVTAPSSFFNEEDTDRCQYFRLTDDISKLWMIDPKTNELHDISLTSEYMKSYLGNINNEEQLCKKMGYKNKESCTNYLTKCITNNNNNDINNCKEFMSNKDYWTNIKSEIEIMNPLLAKITLEKFGFKIIQETDEDSQQLLNKFESYTSWIKNLYELSNDTSNNEFGSDEYNNISNNQQLKGYLELLVNKINSNLSILNSNYVCKTNILNQDTNQFKDTRLYAYGIQSINPNRYSNSKNILRVTELVKNKTYYFLNLVNTLLMQNPFSNRNSNLHYSNLPYMIGGGLDNNTILTEFQPSYETLNEIFNGLHEHLKAKKRDITQVDLTAIRSELDTLRKSESKLIKLISYLEKYIDITDTYKNNDPDNILTVDHIIAFTNKTKNTSTVLTQSQERIFNLLKTIASRLE